VEVTFKDGRRLHSKQIASDPKTDVAIIKLTATSPFAYAEIGDSDAMEIGDRVLAVGAPYGLAGSVTHGIVSAKGRTLTHDPGQYEDFIQTDAAINPGNSGGPLINLEGKVVGINTAIKSQSGGFQGISMAVPSNMAKNVMQQLAKDGVVRRGYLGVQIQDLTADLAEKLGVTVARGVLLGPVADNGPGAKAGLKEGDVITAINGRPVEDGRALQHSIALSSIGKPAEVNIIRDGKSQVVRVVIEQQPGDFLAAKAEPGRRPTFRAPTERDRERLSEKTVAIDKLGVEVADFTPELAERFGMKEIKGAAIVNVEPGSVAQLSGLRRGMVIVQAERKSVDSADALKNALSKVSVEDGVLLLVKTPQGGSRYFVLRGEG
jgi:serine protease Do